VSAYLSRLDEIENLETPRLPSVESVETTINQGIDTLDTAPSGHSQIFIESDEPRRSWRVTLASGESFTSLCSPPASRAEVQGWYPVADVRHEHEDQVEAA
jgi:hypothetical protein